MMSEVTPMPAPSTERGSAMKDEYKDLRFGFLGSKTKATWRESGEAIGKIFALLAVGLRYAVMPPATKTVLQIARYQ